jgi:septal ring factor EnvC (AmiA/AmiB activator)
MHARIARLLGFVSILFLPCAPAAADSAADALRQKVEAQRRLEAEEEARRGEWQQRERDHLAAIEAARSSLEEARENRVRAQDGAHDGIKRSEWTRRAKEAEQALAEAERQLDEFLEEARQSEVPPGWLESGD